MGLKSGDGGGDNVIKQATSESVSALQPEHVSLIRTNDTNAVSGVHLDKHTDTINAANESTDGTNPYRNMTADAAQVALATNEDAIKMTMARIQSLTRQAELHTGRGQADDLLGQVEIKT